MLGSALGRETLLHLQGNCWDVVFAAKQYCIPEFYFEIWHWLCNIIANLSKLLGCRIYWVTLLQIRVNCWGVALFAQIYKSKLSVELTHGYINNSLHLSLLLSYGIDCEIILHINFWGDIWHAEQNVTPGLIINVFIVTMVIFVHFTSIKCHICSREISKSSMVHF